MLTALPAYAGQLPCQSVLFAVGGNTVIAEESRRDRLRRLRFARASVTRIGTLSAALPKMRFDGDSLDGDDPFHAAIDPPR